MRYILIFKKKFLYSMQYAICYCSVILDPNCDLPIFQDVTWAPVCHYWRGLLYFLSISFHGLLKMLGYQLGMSSIVLTALASARRMLSILFPCFFCRWSMASILTINDNDNILRALCCPFRNKIWFICIVKNHTLILSWLVASHFKCNPSHVSLNLWKSYI